MNCISLLALLALTGLGNNECDQHSSRLPKIRELSFAQKLEKIEALTESDTLIDLIKSDKAISLTDFPVAAQGAVLALVLSSGTINGVAVGDVPEETTVDIKVYARLHFREEDGTYHEFEVKRPDKRMSLVATAQSDQSSASERLLNKLQWAGVIDHQITIEDVKRYYTKFDELDADTRAVLMELVSFSRTITEGDATLDFKYDLDRIQRSRIDFSVQAFVTLTHKLSGAAKVYSIDR